MKKIAVLGYGTVGSGVVELMEINAKTISENAAEPIEVKYILDIRDFSNDKNADKFVKDFAVIENDPEICVVVETIGGTNPAYDFTKRALLSGKNVVTSNKELVATHGAELLSIAREKNLNYLFEASVGGGIPIIRPIAQCLAANKIDEIYGILNGTTNYILTRMIKAGLTFEKALSEAQELGYAERDPSADIEGHDACRKICILASLAFGRHIYPKYIKTEGITKVTLDDVRLAGKAGCVIRLLGRTKLSDDGKVFAYVGPHLVPKDSPIASVEDVFNGIMVHGNMIGNAMFYGPGAGKYPTASAVSADIIDAVKHIRARKYLDWDDAGEEIVADMSGFESKYYVRILGENARSIAAQIFEDIEFIEDDEAVAFITARIMEKVFEEKLDAASQKCNILSHMRVL